MIDVAATPMANRGEEVLRFLARKVARTSPWSLNGRHYDVELIFVDTAGVCAALHHRPLSSVGAITRRRDYVGELYVPVGADDTREAVMDRLACALDPLAHRNALHLPRVRRAFESLRAVVEALEAGTPDAEADGHGSPSR